MQPNARCALATEDGTAAAPSSPSANENPAELAASSAADTSSSTSRLLSLPPEILLNVLENTDLVAPGGQVHWQPTRQDQYSLPFDAKYGTTWKPPAALFLVGKAFSAVAHKVFLERNRIIISPDTTGFYQLMGEGARSSMPQRYAASEFLEHASSSGRLSLLRTLRFNLFAMVDEQVAEEARADWFGVLDQLQKAGDLNLRCLIIDSNWEGHEEKDWLSDDTERKEGEKEDEDGLLDQVRGFVEDNGWRFVSPGGPPMGITRQLFVRVTSDSARTTYFIRKKDEGQLDEAHGREDWGALRAARIFTWAGQSKDPASCSSGSSNSSQVGEWVEELWVKEMDHL
ncbi:hypothetical protein PG995_011803 [Apiospora arundinis]